MENESGYDPLDLRVLIRLDEVDDTFENSKIIKLEKTVNEGNMQQVTGTIIACGENAFCELNNKPKAGDRVVIGKYVGWLTTGDDEKEYRIINDEDVIAFRREK